MKIKEIALFLLGSSMFMAMLAQYDRFMITKIIFVMIMLVMALFFSKVAFPKKKKEFKVIP